MTLSLRTAGRSDVGLVRAGNEDSGFAQDGPQALLVVADGMGGHAAGVVASRLPTEQVAGHARDQSSSDSSEESSDPADALRKVVAEADAAVAAAVRQKAERAGMGTTLTIALLDTDELVVAQVGDSRGYLWRDGQLAQLTHDQTYVQKLIDDGQLTPDEAAEHPARSVLTQAVDGSGHAEPVISRVPVRAGDRVLLCSDGLTAVVDDADLAELLVEASVDRVVDSLVRAALDGGAPDNVTVVVADVVEDGPASSPMWLGAATPLTADAVEPGADAGPADDEPAQSRGGPMGLLGLALVLTGLAVVAFAGVHAWASNQWQVADRDGRVAIYRGLPEGLLGLPTGGPVSISEVRVSNLPTLERASVESGLAADDESDARDILNRLRAAERLCVQPDPAQGCPER